MLDHERRIVDLNDHPATELGLTPQDFIGQPFDSFGVATAPGFSAALDATETEGTAYFEHDVPVGDGSVRRYNFAARAVAVDGRGFVLSGRPLESLAHARSQVASVLKLAELSEDIFVVSNRVGIVTYANAAAARVHGPQEFVGRHVSEFVHEDDQGFETLIKAVLEGADRAEARVLAHRANHEPVTLEVRMIFDTDSDQWFTIERDVSATVEQERKLRALTEDLRRQANTDALTGLANRTALNARITNSIENEEPFALLLLDMDDFKSINDMLGHAAGDEFLQVVARRLEGAVRPGDLVARVGGDEFVAFLPAVGSADAGAIAKEMIDAVGESFAVAGREITRSCSIGVAAHEPGEDVSTVLRKADRAAYRAKHEGRSRYVMFE